MKTFAIKPDLAAIERTLSKARRLLLSSRVPAGHWEGELSSSALSTATAVCALEILRRKGGEDRSSLAARGLRWLAGNQNEDGGFGDTTDSPSNLSTTVLCWAALGTTREAGPAFLRAEAWLKEKAGDLAAPSLAKALGRRYGEDRTFAVPILTMGALAGRFGESAEAWKSIPALPFELAALPRAAFRRLNLQVVSYALPALIAIGQVHHAHRPSRNPFARLARSLARRKTLNVLESIQPESGGFLEAVPLTSFVTMSLAAAGEADHPVTRKGAAFLAASAREDGSWPIDTNLATWVTTLSIEALSRSGALPAEDRRAILKWLLGQQMWREHPYTGSAPGGWAWTDRSGGVPDADDTSGALLALSRLREGEDPEVRSAARSGIRWLLDLQNRDGGIPTFCRGWGKLPFDRSCPDLTAHALRAWHAWNESGPVGRALRYLDESQNLDGSWTPLWFGSQRRADESNPIYGTSRVLLCAPLFPGREAWKRGTDRLLSAQNPDGGFGSSIEETALAVEALCGLSGAENAVTRACAWLVERTAEGTRFDPAPIGLYFARLWYSERLYPLIFTVSALGRAIR